MENTFDDVIGKNLADRYMIQQEVGRGRIGLVLKAFDTRLDRTVAVKLLYQDVTNNETGYARFEREARSTGCLAHPNIVTVLDFGLSDETFPYLVMEYLDGNNLQDVLGTNNKLGLEKTIRIASQVCSALGHAHNRGVIHRDLKPSNIMLIDVEGFPEFVKLVDFGIAKRFDMDEDTFERLTMEGQVIGTPAYMSPEQCGAKRLDHRSDVYSLGCVLFKMLTGSAPYAGAGFLDIMQAHMHRPPLRFEDVPGAPHVPADIQHVVYKALAKLPDHRQQSMSEFRFQLNNAMSTMQKTGQFIKPVFADRSFVDAVAQEQPSLQPQLSYTATGDGSTGIEELIHQVSINPDPHLKFTIAMKYAKGEGTQVNKPESTKWLYIAANAGHVEAQYQLARHLLEGDIHTLRSPAEAVSWLQRAAEQGFEAAQYSLGTCYETGEGTALDLVQAIHWYRLASAQGNRQAEQQLAACYRVCSQKGLQPEGYVDWLSQRALEGDPVALYGMACQLKTAGSTAAQNEANQYLSHAASKGHVPAQLEVARLMIEGKRALGHMPPEIFGWVSNAVKNGCNEALALLACCYKNGIGTPPDPQQAIQLLQKAADYNDTDAQVLLGTAMLTGEGAPRNITRGIALMKNAAAEGNYCAQWKLALCYKNGLGTTRDTREAEKWFIKSAEGRFSQGLFWSGNTQGLRFEEAVQTFQALSNLDHKHAHYWLGICAEDGIVFPQNLQNALACYQRAAQKGLEHASVAANRLRNQLSAGAPTRA